MREILFRGKRIGNGEWVEGWYCQYPFGRWPLKTAIIPNEMAADGHFIHEEVDHETVCQFTGLTDKNGVKIFEGDILEVGSAKYLVKHSPYSCGFQADGFDLNGIWSLYHICNGCNEGKQAVIIGNIHDNPELLKGER